LKLKFFHLEGESVSDKVNQKDMTNRPQTKLPEEFKQAYMAEVSRLLERAYEARTLQTTISDTDISLTINVPRHHDEADRDTVGILTQVHRVML
jgi:hypothetical protein